jgi:DNA-binding Lrp family transcriptional regulator
MPIAIYLIKTEAGKEKEIKKKLLEDLGFDEAYVVTGPFDVVGKIFIPLSRRGLEELKEEIEKISGVKEIKYLEVLASGQLEEEVL